MSTIIGSLARKATNHEKLNIITFNAHERYQSLICKTNHNFYAFTSPEMMVWNETYNKIPDNYYLLEHNSLPIDMDFDLVLCPARVHFELMKSMCKSFHLPMLFLEVFVPNTGVHHNTVLQAKKIIHGDINVFINEYGRNVWGWNEQDRDCFIIPHGIETERFSFGTEERVPRIVSAVNKWKERDWSHGYYLWEEVTTGLPRMPLGTNPGLSKPVEEEELIQILQKSSIFINTTLSVPVPTALLEAMSCGCAVVTTATGDMPSFIKDGVNGFITNDKTEMRSRLELLLQDATLCRKLGEAARKTIEEEFSMNHFISNWNKVLRKTASLPYIG